MSKAHKTPKRPRIVDVARLADVSPQTVSNVINRRGGFTEPTRLKVEAAVAELGFQPNRYAQSLRWQRTGLIGFDMVRRQLDVSNPFTVGLLHALVPAARRHDLRVLVVTHDENSEDEFRATASSGLVDGFVLSDSTTGDPRAAVLQELGVPFVVMGRPGTPIPVPAVELDNAAGIRQAVDHVVAQGCRDIAYVGYSGPEHWNVERRRGIREGLAAHGIPLPRHRVLTSPSLTTIRRRLPDFLAAEGGPDAVVANSDSIAVSIVGIAGGLGIRVGQDLAVTGFDDSPLATLVSPELTSVAIPVDPIAERLVVLLKDAIDGAQSPGSVTVPTHLVVRASSGFTPPHTSRKAASAGR
ncbi:MAG TPA: LacI family DNA-binding transcriptional regulator [Ornithinibacter sp.]|nr:LacI family DNA-binding transcriptional regulator [Ornithinibacter sp.]